MIDEETANRIRRLDSLGWSKRKISKECNVTRSTIVSVLGGSRPQARMTRLPTVKPSWMPDDYGMPIPGSRYVRNYCRVCHGPGRTEIAGYWVCECQGKELKQRVVKSNDPYEWWRASQ